MYQMEKITTGVSYTTSAVGTGYWFLQLLDRVSPSQWAAALKQKLRQNLEARLDAEVDAILDELLGVPAVPEPEGIADDSTVSDGVGSQPDGSEEPQPDGEMMM
ncbi:DUF826 domain-containing protein [Escherichia coli]|nr:DUF826 domain-containing protein [Escherichia coli]NAI75464.1 DUF826 domain-containing protein [Escherichia coli]NAJ00382.1 DUF826 domain-containing protein [Escherichia coli]NAL29352.1 DUF826 domain-containing protein [Escherichia coli]